MAKIAAGSMGFAGSLDYALLHPRSEDHDRATDVRLAATHCSA